MVTREAGSPNKWVVRFRRNACHTHCDGPVSFATIPNMFEGIDRWENEGGALPPIDVTTNTSTQPWTRQLPEPQPPAMRRGWAHLPALPGLRLTQADCTRRVDPSPERDE